MFTYAREAKRLLGVDHTNTLPDIKAAFRQCVKKYHPDVLGNTPASVRYFQQINRVHGELIKYKQLHPDVVRTDTDSAKKSASASAHGHTPRYQTNAQPSTNRPRSKPTTEQLILQKVQKLKQGTFKVDPLVAHMSIESLIMRCEFSDNFYVKREAIKALVSKGTVEAVRGIVYLQNSQDKESREIIADILTKSDSRFRRMVHDDDLQINPFFAWVDKLVSGIIRVFDGSVRISY